MPILRKTGFLHKYHLKLIHEIIALCLGFGLYLSYFLEHEKRNLHVAISSHNVKDPLLSPEI